jgi:hypothetical protein
VERQGKALNGWGAGQGGRAGTGRKQRGCCRLAPIRLSPCSPTSLSAISTSAYPKHTYSLPPHRLTSARPDDTRPALRQRDVAVPRPSGRPPGGLWGDRVGGPWRKEGSPFSIPSSPSQSALPGTPFSTMTTACRRAIPKPQPSKAPPPLRLTHPGPGPSPMARTPNRGILMSNRALRSGQGLQRAGRGCSVRRPAGCQVRGGRQLWRR